jgi:hypothetical protein
VKSSRTTGCAAALEGIIGDWVIEVEARVEVKRNRPQQERARAIEVLRFIVKFPMNWNMK